MEVRESVLLWRCCCSCFVLNWMEPMRCEFGLGDLRMKKLVLLLAAIIMLWQRLAREQRRQYRPRRMVNRSGTTLSRNMGSITKLNL